MLPDAANATGEGILGLAVPRETMDRLIAYVAVLKRWQSAHNLVGPGTLDDIWRRHIADSAQLVALFPDARRWLDLGSGAGFPGLVIAILLHGRPGAAVGLVESNQKKCAFLREAIRVTGAPAEVCCERIESVVKRWSEPVDVVTARALAPLAILCGYVERLVASGAIAVFHKGRGFDMELRDARQIWDIDLVQHPVRGGGSIVEIRRLGRREKEHA
jgi:16S rRNA (guanine527-N7)-methyltransferase